MTKRWGFVLCLAATSTEAGAQPEAPDAATAPQTAQPSTPQAAPQPAPPAPPQAAPPSAVDASRASEDPARRRAEMKAVMKEAYGEYLEEQSAKRQVASIRNHDGWYVRLGFNIGYAIDSAELGGSSMKSHGFGAFFDYALGGNVSEHWVLAFGHHLLGVFSPETTVEGANFERDHTAFYHLYGILLDYYPDSRAGLHFTGTFGMANADVYVQANEDTSLGAGLALGGGYDVWIGDQWSLGAGARLLAIFGAVDNFGEHRTFIPMLTLSALHH